MILLDTHVVLWLFSDRPTPSDPVLGPEAAAAIAEARRDGSGIAVADITLWELAMLAARSRIALPETLDDLLRRVETSFTLLRMDRRIASQSQQFSDRYPRDPADRIIGATAVVHGLQLVTRDVQMRASGEVPCIW